MVKRLCSEAIAITSYLKIEIVNVKSADGESLMRGNRKKKKHTYPSLVDYSHLGGNPYDKNFKVVLSG